MALGGRVAESLTFNQVTTGAQNDLDKVTKIAYAQIRQYGMNEKVGLISFGEDQTGPGSKKPYSKVFSSLMDEEARRLVYKAYQKTEQVLRDNKDKLEKVCMHGFFTLQSETHSCDVNKGQEIKFIFQTIGFSFIL